MYCDVVNVPPRFNFSDEIIILNLEHADSHHNETVQGVGWYGDGKERQDYKKKERGWVGLGVGSKRLTATPAAPLPTPTTLAMKTSK